MEIPRPNRSDAVIFVVCAALGLEKLGSESRPGSVLSLACCTVSNALHNINVILYRARL